jgi:hypothetical protein
MGRGGGCWCGRGEGRESLLVLGREIVEDGFGDGWWRRFSEQGSALFEQASSVNEEDDLYAERTSSASSCRPLPFDEEVLASAQMRVGSGCQPRGGAGGSCDLFRKRISTIARSTFE